MLAKLIKNPFQFPTGWNSTLDDFTIEQQINRFNSQRDGILLFAAAPEVLEKGFQFPTGWNSTFVAVFTALFDKKFQFPTRWNSTNARSKLSISARSFNSHGKDYPPNLPSRFYSVEARNLPRRINSARFYFTLFISISPSCAPISIRSPVLISSLRIISAILSSTKS